MPLPIAFQGLGDPWRKKRTAFVATQVTRRRAPAVKANINERPEMMILRLAMQCAFFFHFGRITRLVPFDQARELRRY